ncbi:MAG: HTH-type transcriptional regulator GltR [Stenotrophomonas maltophilia]|nr:MAG: HTH-type transcriptional regulator GltR [Stenotrophomonas maltophilia]
MDLTSLAIFRAVAEEQSVTRAAQRLQRAQSNVTTRIQQLEEDLGVSLFLRDGKRMALTDAGRDCLRYAEQLLALADEARQALHPTRAQGTLRLGSMESTAASRLPRILADYHRACPEVLLEVTTGTSQALIDGVLERRLDCALVAHPAALDLPDGEAPQLERGLEGLAVFRESLLLVLPPEHPPVTRAEEVQPLNLASFARGCTYRALAEDWLAPREAALRVQEVGSYHAVLACVAAGACVGILPRSVLALCGEAAQQVQVLPIREVDTLLVWRSGYATAAFARLRQGLQV